MNVTSSLLQLTWPQYFAQIKAAETTEIFQTRLRVVRTARALFSHETRFCDLDAEDRIKIGGMRTKNASDFVWFGGMSTAGTFRSVINANNSELSLALDFIPCKGDVSADAYPAYVKQFKRAFPRGGGGIRGATRLLAMKRPDVFVCISNRNRGPLCDALAVSSPPNLSNYWDVIIRPIRKAVWWDSLPPDPGDERDVWDARVAFLDALFRQQEMP